MSIKAMNWAWAVEGVSSSDKIVLLRLADHANGDGVAWPGKDTMAKACSMSKRSVDRAIARLEGHGLLRVEKRLDEQGRNTSNTYVLSLQQPELFGGVILTPPDDRMTPRGVIGDNLGVSDLHPEGVRVTPEPPLEPKEEPTPPPARTRARELGKFQDYQPPAIVQDRVRMKYPAITDEFIAEQLPEFLTYAESHYRRDQLDAKFQSCIIRNWVRELSGSGALPRKLEDLVALADKTGGPKPYPGESPGAYRERYDKWNTGAGGLRQVAQAEPAKPWYRDWPQVLERAAAFGINQFEHSEPADLLGKLIGALSANDEDVPPDLVSWRDRLKEEAA